MNKDATADNKHNLASCGVYFRGKFCGNLKVYRPTVVCK